MLQAGVLVTLGDRHLLDGLVAVDSVEARVVIVRGSGEACERSVLASRGLRRATLVDRDVKGDKWSSGSSARAS